MLDRHESLLIWLLHRLHHGFGEDVLRDKLAGGVDALDTALMPIVAAAARMSVNETVIVLSAQPAPEISLATEPDVATVLTFAQRKTMPRDDSVVDPLDIPLPPFEITLTSVDALHEFVDGDAAPLSAIMNGDQDECPRCGTQLIEDDSTICPGCKAPIAQVTMLPFVPAATVRASYRALVALAHSDAVRTFGPVPTIQPNAVQTDNRK